MLSVLMNTYMETSVNVNASLTYHDMFFKSLADRYNPQVNTRV